MTEPAHAGEYVLRSCDVPGYPNASLGPWVASADSSNMVVADACASGDGVGFRFPGLQEMESGNGPALGLAVPREGPRRAIGFVKVALWYAARLGGTGPPFSVYSHEWLSELDTHRYWMTTGPPGAESLSFEQELNPTSTTSFRVFLGCGPITAPHPPEPCVADHAMPLQVRGMEVTLREDVPPTVLRPDGTLLAGGTQSGVRTVSYAATDSESGLAKVDVLLDQNVVKSHDLAPRCFYSDFTVCPVADDDTLEVDTRAIPNGSYDLALRVRDAAGNERVVHAERAVVVANELAPAATNVVPYAVVAKFSGTSRSTLTASYGRRVSVRGRLTQGSRPVAAGTQIELLEKLDRRGAKEVSTARVKTKADGSFSTVLATTRPSRTVRLAYRPPGVSRVVSHALKLRVRAASRLTASLHGRVLRFRGRVLSGPIGRNGKHVRMEGRATGSAWTTFKRVRTDRSGRFSGTYRIRVRRPGVVLKIRALVPSEAGYGYLASRSGAVTLRVR